MKGLRLQLSTLKKLFSFSSNSFFSTVAGASALIVLFSFISRATGFIREIVTASFFGINVKFDFFLVGAVLPVIIVSIIQYFFQNFFIPVYLNIYNTDKSKSEVFFRKIFLFVIIYSALFLILISIFADLIVGAFIAGGEGKSIAKNVMMIMICSIPFQSLAYLISSYLQAHKDFSLPAISQLWMNLLSIISIILLTRAIDIYSIPAGYLLGSIFQFGFLLWKLKLQGFKLFGDINYTYRKNQLWKMISLVLLIEIFGQLYVFIDRLFVEKIDAGGLASLNYASIIYLLPISMVAIGFSTAIFPRITETLMNKEFHLFSLIFRKAVAILVFLFLPLTIVFIFWSQPIIQLFFQRGEFDNHATLITSKLLSIYAASLLFISIYSLINKTLFAQMNYFPLLFLQFLGIVSKLLLSVLLVDSFKQYGLAVSSTISYLFISIAALIYLFKKLEILSFTELVKDFFLILINSLFSFLLTLFIYQYFHSDLFIINLLFILIFFFIYFFNSFLLKSVHVRFLYEEYFIKSGLKKTPNS